MARGKQRRNRFLAEHTVCCFCGGDTPAQTVDHVPSRATFHGRVWPEGYEFPACHACNNSTARQEQVVSLLARMGAPSPTPSQLAEFNEQLAGLHRNLPDVLEEMRPSRREVRTFLTSRGYELSPGFSTADVPIITVGGPLVVQAVTRFATKLFLALHYKHTGLVLPTTGGIALKWITNATRNDSQIVKALEQIRTLLPHRANLQRASIRFDDQFSYQYYASPDRSFSVFFVIFSHTLAFFALVKQEEGTFPDFMLEHGVLKPLSHH